MITRSLPRLASLTVKLTPSFAKDPFEKFKKDKKTTPEPPQQQPASKARKSSQKTWKKPTRQHTTQQKKKFAPAEEEKQPEEKIDVQETAEQKPAKGFDKFFKRTPKPEPPKESQQPQEQPPKEEKQQESKGGRGFANFKRKTKSEEPESKETPKTAAEENESKEKESEAKEEQILRKPRAPRKPEYTWDYQTRPEPEKKEEAEEQKKEAEATAEMKAKTQEELQQEKEQKEKELWEELQRSIKIMKDQFKLKHQLRYERLNLINKQVKGKAPPPPPPDMSKSFVKLIMAGVGLMLLSGGEYFWWKSGEEVDPQYLKEALADGRVLETWFHHIINESNSDDEEQITGVNYVHEVYIREANGDVYYCQSNNDFQQLWAKMVMDYNLMVESRGSNVLPGQLISEGEVPRRKVILSPTQSSKEKSALRSAKSVLSMILLFFFLKQLMDMRGRGGRLGGGGGRGGGGMSEMFDNQKSYRFQENITVTFQDVVGMQKAKEEIVEFIDFLKFPKKYNDLGASIPRGALLTGPPGTGKTMIAKACAGESKVPFFTISGSEFIEMYVGVGAQRVRSLFKEAKEKAPSIIFIDEIDAVGKKRSGLQGGGGNDERDTTLNQLLVEMDGFDSNSNVIVFAATNQKEVLDPALTRPGRFDRLIEIDLPDLEGRKEIFQVHLKPLAMESGKEVRDYAKRLATLTPGFSGADIKNVCNEAAIIAARSNKEAVSVIDFEMATERIIGGVEKKSQLITKETRKTVAYHECGHGVVSWFMKHANPLLKLTIIPRSKGALGFAQYLPNEQQMYTRQKLMDQICVILGGRVSEEVFFGKISTGASDDLNKAYKLAKGLVAELGFSEKLGWLQYQETEYAKEYSKEIEDAIDSEILEIMRECSERTRKIVNDKRELIERLAEKLLELETIDQNIIESILGERPYELSQQHKEYIREKKLMQEESKVAENAQATQAESRSKYLA